MLEPAFEVPAGLPRLRELGGRWLGWAAKAGLPGGWLAFALLALLSVALDPQFGKYVLATGWLGHALWDLWHWRANKDVSRSFAEWCLRLPRRRRDPHLSVVMIIGGRRAGYLLAADGSRRYMTRSPTRP